jgi:hypothetical protein
LDLFLFFNPNVLSSITCHASHMPYDICQMSFITLTTISQAILCSSIWTASTAWESQKILIKRSLTRHIPPAVSSSLPSSRVLVWAASCTRVPKMSARSSSQRNPRAVEKKMEVERGTPEGRSVGLILVGRLSL